MTAKERMVAAAKRQPVDRVPVSPELWDAFSFKVTGLSWRETGGHALASQPLWRAILATHRHFGTDAWVLPDVGLTPRQARLREDRSTIIGEQTIETVTVYHAGRGELREVKHTSPWADLWHAEHAVKDLERDLPLYLDWFFDDPAQADRGDIEAAVAETGEDGAVEANLGGLFFDFVATLREGGSGQAIYDLSDRPALFKEVQKRYISHLANLAEVILTRTKVDGIFLNCGYGTQDIEGPRLYAEWDAPVLRAVAAVAHRCGSYLHLHQHGSCMRLLPLIAETGVDVVDGIERPPQADGDLAEAKRLYGDRMALKGNVNVFFPLSEGSPADVEAQVRECIEVGAPGGGFILGTGDSALGSTPLENMWAYVAAGRRYGSIRE